MVDICSKPTLQVDKHIWGFVNAPKCFVVFRIILNTLNNNFSLKGYQIYLKLSLRGQNLNIHTEIYLEMVAFVLSKDKIYSTHIFTI